MTLAGLVAVACGKTENPAANNKSEAPVVADIAEPEPEPVSHVAAIETFVATWNSGKISDAFSVLVRDAVVTPVDSPAFAEITGRVNIIKLLTKQATMLVDSKLTIVRIIDAGEHAVVEYVSSGSVRLGGPDDERLAPYAFPVAHVLHFNAKGAIDRMWIFQDDEIFAWQIGARPGAPEGHVSSSIPDSHTIESGARNDTLVKAHGRFFGALDKPESLDMVIAEQVSDDFRMADARSGKTLDKAAFAEWFKTLASDFSDLRTEVEIAISAGDIAAIVSTRRGNHKGGRDAMPVMWKALDIVRAQDGKLVSLTSYHNGMGILKQLGVLPTP